MTCQRTVYAITLLTVASLSVSLAASQEAADADETVEITLIEDEIIVGGYEIVRHSWSNIELAWEHDFCGTVHVRAGLSADHKTITTFILDWNGRKYDLPADALSVFANPLLNTLQIKCQSQRSRETNFREEKPVLFFGILYGGDGPLPRTLDGYRDGAFSLTPEGELVVTEGLPLVEDD